MLLTTLLQERKFSRGHYPFLWIKLWSPNEKSMFEKFVKFVTKTNLSKRKLLVIGNAFTAYFFYKRKTNVGKLLRPVLFDNIKPSSNIIWVEGGEINQQSWQKCDCFQNNFFFDAIENLKKSEWGENDARADVSHSGLKAIFKYWKHPIKDSIKKH